MNRFLVSLFLMLSVCSQMNAQDIVTIERDGFKYVGEYPEGEGTLYSESRGMYIGHFVDCVLQGKGVHYLPKKSVYKGNFVNGRHQGMGRFFSSSGKVISGEFQADFGNGRDTLYYPDGKVFIGICHNSAATGQGKEYKSAAAAGIPGGKPVFQDPELSPEQKEFLLKIGYWDDMIPARFVYKNGKTFFQGYVSPSMRVTRAMIGVEATVKYSFTVEADGSVTDVRVEDETGLFEDELTRVLKKSPKWRPAMKAGVPVSSRVENDIEFHFSD